ncbi:MAG TPA: DUF1499 domain-containing protein [Roseiarcus sp.]|nr:DUF1499 domain-containing protein [Roseiarcus sp.]
MRRLIIEEPYSTAAIWSRRVGLFALAVAAVAVLLSRLGAVDPPGALAVLGGALILACLAGLLAAAAFVVIWRTGRRGAGLAWAGLIMALLMLAYPAYLTWKAISLPIINDVSTDLETPPTFMLSAKARLARGNRTPPESSQATREAQRLAYPAVQPIMVDLETNDAYRLALDVAKQSHWRIVDAVAPSVRENVGHIDAIAGSLVMGFPSDIAIRIKPSATQTRIDIRSVSRVGRHDFGDNARRIQKFAAAIAQAAKER